MKIKIYNYLMMVFLHPKGMSKGSPNVSCVWSVVGGTKNLYFINNLSLEDKLCIACATKNPYAFLFIDNNFHCSVSQTRKLH